MKRIIFDVDGVLADFLTGFTRLGNALFQTPVVTSDEHEQWNVFPGMTPEMVDRVWKIVKQFEARFWFNLPALPALATFRRIRDLIVCGHEVYIVTSRPGEYAKRQTEQWLESRGIPTPTVIVSSKKGEAAAMLGADYCLEDKAENAWCVVWLSPKTKSFLLNRKSNQYDPNAFGSHRVRRVDTVEEFLDIVVRGE